MSPFILVEETVLGETDSGSCIHQPERPHMIPWYTSGFE